MYFKTFTLKDYDKKKERIIPGYLLHTLLTLVPITIVIEIFPCKVVTMYTICTYYMTFKTVIADSLHRDSELYKISFRKKKKSFCTFIVTGLLKN